MADGAKEDVKGSGEASDAVKQKDEKGVPWENRAKEYERKLDETRKEMAELKRSMQEAESEVNAPDETEKAEAKKKKLTEFVEDPDGYIERKVQEREVARQIPQAEEWLKGQKDWADGDDIRVYNVIREHGIGGLPMARAKAAWKMLQAEKLEKEFADFKANGKRETKVSKSASDGPGRGVDAETKPRRAELIKKLKQAQHNRDERTTLALLDQLEDVRE